MKKRISIICLLLFIFIGGQVFFAQKEKLIVTELKKNMEDTIGLQNLTPVETIKKVSNLSVFSISDPTQEEINWIGELISLKELKLDGVDSSLDLSPLSKLQQLEKLDIMGRELDYAFLEKLNNLREVDIWDSGMEDLSCFRHMEQLERLSVSFLQTADFQYLAKAKNLEELRLSHCDERVNHESLNLSSLVILDIYNPTQEEIEWIGGMINLQDLTFSSIDVYLDLSPLERLIHLQKLNLGSWPYNGKLDLSPVGTLTQLEEIELWGVDTDYSFLQYLQHLKLVRIYRASIGDLSCFKEMKELRELTVETVDKVNFECLKGLSNLETLDIYFKSLEEGDKERIKVLGELENLSEIILEGYSEPEKPININFLCELEKLEGLSITNIPLQSLEPLSGADSLVWLYLNSTNIQDIEPLKGLEKLEYLVIEGNTSKKVAEQSKLYFSHVETVEIGE